MNKKSMNQTAQTLGEEVLRLLYPLHCPVCDGIVSRSEGRICAACEKKLKLLTPPWCMKCGKKVEDGEEFCPDCRERTHVFVRGRALYDYSCAAASLYRFKYSGRREYAKVYGEMVADYLGDYIRSIAPDALIPSPLHAAKKNARGYNQAELHAREIGRRLQIPVVTDVLVRQKNTLPLKCLTPSERQNNLKNAFNIRQNDVKSEVTILIDDIYTTGATMDEAARTLMAAGVRKVYALSLACGTGV